MVTTRLSRVIVFETIRRAGFNVVFSQKRYGAKLYTIQAVD